MNKESLEVLASKANPEKWKSIGIEPYDEGEVGFFGVDFGDGHVLDWDLEGTCPKCLAIVDLILRVPELLARIKELKSQINDKSEWRNVVEGK